MQVLKRGNRGYEPLHFDKIQLRIQNLCKDLPVIDIAKITIGVINNIHDKISTEELDRISARIAESFKLIHPDYSILAARIMISNLHKTTPSKFSECMKIHESKLDAEKFKFIMENADELDSAIIHDNDYQYDYFGYCTLEAIYLRKINICVMIGDDIQYVDIDGVAVTDRVIITDGHPTSSGVCVYPLTRKVVVDRPQYMIMRVAIQKYGNVGIKEVIESYKIASSLNYTNATPTLINACDKNGQSLSCFLQGMDDSIEDIMDTLKDSSIISKHAGGVGIWGHYIRPRGSLIASTGGKSCGLPTMLKMFDNAALCWDQGGKRLGAFAIYLEPWHGDIKEFLELKLNQGKEEFRARNLFYALWMPDLIMKRIEADLPISLFNSDTAPGLADVYDGMDVCSKCRYCSNPNYNKYIEASNPDYYCDHVFEKVDAFSFLYCGYEKRGLAIRRFTADEFTTFITFAQKESGTPYICYKDQANRLSNQSNIDTTRSSNLCVTPDTYILTDKGQFMIADLVGQEVNVWNGQEFSAVIPVKTGKNCKILKIELSNGVIIKCTLYHKFYIRGTCGIKKINARDLAPGDVLIDYSLPQGTPESIVSGLELLREFCDKMQCNHNNISHYLHKVRRSLQTIGVETNVECNEIEGARLRLTTRGQLMLESYGFDCTVFGEVVPNGVMVIGISNEPGLSDTYCFTEKKRGMGMFNGVLTGQCSEIMEVSTPNSYACCTLASVNLKKFLVHRDGKYHYDHEKLHEITRIITRDLDMIIDSNKYPVVECIDNSTSLRPIAIGVQGLADLFCIMRIPFLSDEAKQLRRDIHETMYHAALSESAHRAQLLGSYRGFEGSPASLGKLHPDLWAENTGKPLPYSSRYDFNELRRQVMRGLRNSLHIALMPTASTAPVLGNNDSFEPFPANIGTKSNLAGKFTVTNNYMITHLIELGLWSDDVSKRVMNSQGSLQGIPGIPADIKEIYKTVWEISQSELINEAADISAWVDQGMSLNIHMTNNSHESLKKLMLHSWKAGLKTGSYYIRTRAGASAMKNNISVVNADEPQVCRMEEGCLSCQ